MGWSSPHVDVDQHTEMDVAVELVCASLIEGHAVDVPHCRADPVRMGAQQTGVEWLTREVAWIPVRCDWWERLVWRGTKGDRVRIVNRCPVNKLDGIAHFDGDVARNEEHHHGLAIRRPNGDMMVVGDLPGVVQEILPIPDECLSLPLRLSVVVGLRERVRCPCWADIDVAEHRVMDKAAVGEVTRHRECEAVAGSTWEETPNSDQARAKEGFPIVGTTALMQNLDGGVGIKLAWLLPRWQEGDGMRFDRKRVPGDGIASVDPDLIGEIGHTGNSMVLAIKAHQNGPGVGFAILPVC